MNTTLVLLAAQQATDTGPDLTPLVTLIGSAGIATIVVNIVKGLWVNSQVRGPRARVQAIRDGAETLALLTPGSAPFRAVEKQVLAEAEALAAPRRRWWSWLAAVWGGPGLMTITVTREGVSAAAFGMLEVSASFADSRGEPPTQSEVLARARRSAKYGTWAYIAAAIVLALTVGSFFTPLAPETQTVVAAIGGALVVVLPSAASALQQWSSALTEAVESARGDVDTEGDDPAVRDRSTSRSGL